MKILIVEDDTASRILLGKILRKENYEAVLVGDGFAAKNALKSDKFDAVLTDWMMPHMDGLELIGFIKKEVNPCPVILVITALASKDAKEKALNAGADDFIPKPFRPNDIIDRINLNLLRYNADQLRNRTGSELSRVKFPDYIGVGIAASTGGPQTLLKVFSGLNYTNKAVFFVVLHGPSWMLETFSDRIQKETDLVVKLGKDGMSISAGNVYISPGEIHMVINNNRNTIQLMDTPPENYVKPSADPLFKSIADAYSSYSVGVVLTGMGKDGSTGAGYISAAGGVVIAQDPSTAALPSMPKSAIDLRIARLVIPLEDIASVITQNVNTLYKNLSANRI
jgi:two-component system, chemotaxis family, protein-glutamate methylesterase/glutaminase